jgi:ubiquitin-protein ligase
VDDDLTEIILEINGCYDSIYKDQKILLRIIFKDYPFKEP